MKKIWKILIGIGILIIVFLVFSVRTCTLEAKTCSDGSTFGGSMFFCMFDKCPEVNGCESNVDCRAGYQCFNISAVNKLQCLRAANQYVCIKECGNPLCTFSETDPIQIKCGQN